MDVERRTSNAFWRDSGFGIRDSGFGMRDATRAIGSNVLFFYCQPLWVFKFENPTPRIPNLGSRKQKSPRSYERGLC